LRHGVSHDMARPLTGPTYPATVKTTEWGPRDETS
jgi:hypothetical protein